jgi:MFS family permease
VAKSSDDSIQSIDTNATSDTSDTSDRNPSNRVVRPGPGGLRPKLFYGWRIVAAACAIQILLGAMLIQSFGLYIAALSQEMAWSKTTLAGAAALQSAESAIIGPLLGWLLDRVGTQVVIRWGIAIFAGGLMLLSQVHSVGMFYLAAVLMALGASLGGYFPLSVTIVQWFRAQRARALSIMSMGLALGGLAVPLLAAAMQRFGWRATALTCGAITLGIGWWLAGVIRSRPETMGEHVDGVAPAAQSAAAQAAAAAQPEFTAREALRTQAFWMLAAGHGLALLVVTAVNVHAITHMKEGLGLGVGTAGWIIMAMTVGQLVGVMLGAVLGDRYDKRKVAAGCMLAHAAGLLCLTYGVHMALLWGFAILHGIAWGLRGPFMQALRADYFGRNSIGVILGLSAALIALGQVGGPMVAGVMADLTGDYRAGFTLLAVVAALGSFAFLWARKPKRPLGAAGPGAG